jgi:hypothetical protein
VSQSVSGEPRFWWAGGEGTYDHCRQDTRSSHFTSWVPVFCALLAGCSDPCQDECKYDAWRCDGSEVEHCIADTAAGAASCNGVEPMYWSHLEACGSGTQCTTQGCTGSHGACCVATP